MATPQPRKQFHALCHEHHIEMRLTEVLITAESPPTQTPAYACPGPDCAVRYTQFKRILHCRQARTGRTGYSASRHMPRDGQRMYLSEINPERRDSVCGDARNAIRPALMKKAS